MDNDILLEDIQLFKQIAEGDERAFKIFFERYRTPVFYFLSKFIYNKSEVEEFVQNTFFILWKRKCNLLNVQHPRNYVFTIARNNACSYLLKLSREKKVINVLWQKMSLGSNTIQDAIELRESEQNIYQSISHLSPIKQQIFVLSRKEGLSHEQIALETGLSKSRVKNVIVEVLKVIKLDLSVQMLMGLHLLKIQNTYFFNEYLRIF